MVGALASDAELVQAVGRGRGGRRQTGNPPLVLVLANTILGNIPVGDVMTWQALCGPLAQLVAEDSTAFISRNGVGDDGDRRPSDRHRWGWPVARAGSHPAAQQHHRRHGRLGQPHVAGLLGHRGDLGGHPPDGLGMAVPPALNRKFMLPMEQEFGVLPTAP